VISSAPDDGCRKVYNKHLSPEVLLHFQKKWEDSVVMFTSTSGDIDNNKKRVILIKAATN
jgi:hypothetical protein